MAVPITFQREGTDPERALRARLAEAPVKHAQALLAGYELLQLLEDRGVLDLLRGLLGAGGEIVTKLAEAGSTPEAVRALRNGMSMLKILGSIDPDILHALVKEVEKEGPPPASPERAPSFWSVAWKLGSKDSRRALGAAAYGLQIFGRALVSAKEK